MEKGLRRILDSLLFRPPVSRGKSNNAAQFRVCLYLSLQQYKACSALPWPGRRGILM